MPTRQGPSRSIKGTAVTDLLHVAPHNAADDPIYVAGTVSVVEPVAVLGEHATSVGNSTTTPLDANQTFTGEWEAVSDYVSILVLVNTDNLAATDSIRIDFSTDGVNLDRSIPVTFQTGGDYCSFPCEASFFRLRIVNGPQAQTFLRAQVRYNAFAESNKLVPLGDSVTSSSAALLTKSSIIGRSSSGGGTFVDVKVNPSGSLQTEVTGTVSIAGTVNIAEPVTVAATDLDIRNLSSVQDSVRNFDSTDSEYLRFAGSVSAVGDTTLITPTAGKRLRLQWVYAINDPTANTSTKITIKLGSAVQYVAWAISKRQQLTGAVDAPLIINLTQLGDVAVTVFYQEVD